MTESDILKALSNVIEPDLGKDLVTLNMIKDVVIEGDNVSFTVVLTTRRPLKDVIKNACINAVHPLVNKKAVVQIKFTANTNSNRRDNHSVLPGVKYNCCGEWQGGVGKSTVAANLALALSRRGSSCRINGCRHIWCQCTYYVWHTWRTSLNERSERKGYDYTAGEIWHKTHEHWLAGR